MMETLALVDSISPTQVAFQQLVDPFVVAPPKGLFSNENGGIPMYLIDTQPVVRNASYAYLLVRFGANGEPSETLPIPSVLVQP